MDRRVRQRNERVPEVKNVKSIVPTSEKETFVREFDLRKINNEDKYDFFRLHYLERIGKVIDVN